MVAKALFVDAGQSNDIGVCVAADVSNYGGFATTVSAVQIVTVLGKTGDPPSSVTRDPVSGTRDLGPRLIGAGAPFNPGTCGFMISKLKELHANAELAGRVNGLSIGLDGSTADRWVPSSAFPSGGPPWFDTFVAHIKAVQTATNSSIRLGGFSWEQGTSDALSGPLSAAWYANFDLMVNGLWNAFSCRFPVVVGRISQDFITNYPGAATNGPTVRAAQVQWCGDNRMPFINTDDLTTMPPDPGYNPHYDSNSTATLGVRYAAAHLGKRQRMDTRR